eukprot:5960579-Pyramimonas_sp.AAC.1
MKFLLGWLLEMSARLTSDTPRAVITRACDSRRRPGRLPATIGRTSAARRPALCSTLGRGARRQPSTR